MISDQSQIAALDAVIASLRRGMLPPKSECVLLADTLGQVRDRVARAMVAAQEKRAKANNRG